MNGILTHTYRGRATKSVTIVGLLGGGRLDVTEGDEFDVYEDHYGNTYVRVDGRETFVQHLEQIDGDEQWYPDGLKASIDRLDGTLERTERRVEGALREKLQAERDAAADRLAALEGATS